MIKDLPKHVVLLGAPYCTINYVNQLNIEEEIKTHSKT
jgi:hypothetical protein